MIFLEQHKWNFASLLIPYLISPPIIVLCVQISEIIEGAICQSLMIWQVIITRLFRWLPTFPICLD